MVIGLLAGRGNVGRTSLSLALARLAAERSKVSLYEYDVVSPKLIPFFPWQAEEVKRRITDIDREKCTLAGKCLEACQFGVIKREGDSVRHRLHLCRGCGACREVCPERAIVWKEVPCGEIGRGEQGNVTLHAARLRPEEGWDGFLTRKLRETFPQQGDAVLKAPLGLSAPALRTVKDSEAFVLVSTVHPQVEDEVKVFGEIIQGFGVPGAVVLNLSAAVPESVSRLCQSLGLTTFSLPRVEGLAPGRELLAEAPELRPTLEEIIAWGGGK